MTKIIVIGSSGQLGSALKAVSPMLPDADSLFYTRTEFDITREKDLDKLFAEKPSVVINASAYTKVDLAESEPDRANAVNRDAVGHLANSCRQLKARLIQVSTDFVFDGGQSAPYQPSTPTHPVSAYGRSKLDGEEAIRNTPDLNTAIVRTAWVYSSTGQNFVKTMLRLMAERDSLNVVYDQVGSPTWARDLAQTLWQLALQPDITGTYHYTNAGVTSWYDFAVAIQEEAQALGLLKKTCKISPILTEAYPTPAKRPHYSVLDCSSLEQALGIERPHWRASLRKMLREL